MKIKTNILKEALQNLGRIVNRTNLLPVLLCVKCEAINGTLTIHASNLDEYQIANLECDGDIEPCCVSLAQLASAIGGEEIEIVQDSKSLTLSFSGNHFRLNTLAAEDFPPVPSGKSSGVGVSCADMAKGIAAVNWAASSDPGRWILQSVHVVGAPKLLKCESTNGRELAIWSGALISSVFDCLVPSAFAPNLCLALERPEAQFSLSENGLSVQHQTGSYFCKQIEGDYPFAKSVIPDNPRTVGIVKTSDMLDVFNRCKMFADGKSESARLTFDMVSLRVKYNSEKGSLDFNVAGKFTPCEVAMGAAQMRRCFEAFQSQEAAEVVWKNSDESSPAVLEAGDLKVISMPYRLV